MWSYLGSTRKWLIKDKQLEHFKHITTLRNMKPAINTQCPFRPTFLDKKEKNSVIFRKKQKNQQITQENNILLQKMLNITQKPGKLNPAYFNSSYKPKKKKPNQQKVFQNKCITQIDIENKHFIDRLTNVQPIINVSKMKKDEDFSNYLINMRQKNIKSIVKEGVRFPFFDNGYQWKSEQQDNQKKAQSKSILQRPTSAIVNQKQQFITSAKLRPKSGRFQDKKEKDFVF